jgi:tetratricopeptide (TPR) repeat protein
MWGNLGDAYHFQGTQEQVAEVAYKRAIGLGEARLEVNPDDSMVISDIALYYSRIGNVEKARELDEKANGQGAGIMYVHYNSALIHVQFGEVDEAFVALERAVELSYERELLRRDPALKGLQDDERFRRLLANNSS